MKENHAQNIICNKCHNAICRESFVTCLTCMKTMKKNCTFKFDMNKYSSLHNKILEMAKSQRTNSFFLHMQELPLTTPLKNYICVLQQTYVETFM